MNPREFLALAEDLSRGSSEAAWRSAVSRAYYAAFHIARSLLSNFGFMVPRADRAHSYLWLRLAHSGHPDVQKTGGEFDALRRARNQADYDLAGVFGKATAASFFLVAERVIQVLETASQEPIKGQITEAMKTYERDVLKDVTWHP